VALETPGRLLGLCSALEPQLESLDEPELAAIDGALPLQSMTLMELSLHVAERRADLARKMDAAANAAAGSPPELRENVLNTLPPGWARSAFASPTSAAARRPWLFHRRPSTSEGASPKPDPTPSSPISRRA
jgi:hypothetical protein